MKKLKKHPTSNISIWLEEEWDGNIIDWKTDAAPGKYVNNVWQPNTNYRESANFIFEAELEMNINSTFKECVCMNDVGNEKLKFNMYAGDFAKSIEYARNNKHGFSFIDGVQFGFKGIFYFNFGRKYAGISPVNEKLYKHVNS